VWQRGLAVLLGGATTALLAAALLPLVRRTPVDVDIPATTTPKIAEAIFGSWVWPFELLSVLLLVALIGAFAVSRLVMAPEEGGR
jgi:NADH:ubiquinone oxidoreductase subunit 6 (subunit J)